MYHGVFERFQKTFLKFELFRENAWPIGVGNRVQTCDMGIIVTTNLGKVLVDAASLQ
jgi:hypothetical protein